jgi:hypothetical protein
MNFDKTFCASPNCTNECGRKMTKELQIDLNMLKDAGYIRPISYAYFCNNEKAHDESGLVGIKNKTH